MLTVSSSVEGSAVVVVDEGGGMSQMSQNVAVPLESGGQSGRLSGADISHKRDFLGFGKPDTDPDR